MTIDAFMQFLRPFWYVWVMLLFIAIVAFAYWPGNRKRLDSYGSIPLQDDAPEAAPKA